jgi:outer membrane protein OmpA-like peptidoglycan-associated protein
MAHWFISHSTKDGAKEAQALAAALEARGERCWIAPRDVEAGAPYPGQIKRAVEGAKGLVVLVTASANDSTDVLQEVQLANQARVKITPVIVRNAKPSDDLQYYVGVRHQVRWSTAQAVADAVAGARPVSADASPPGKQSTSEKTPTPKGTPNWLVPGGIAGTVAVALIMWSPWKGQTPEDLIIEEAGIEAAATKTSAAAPDPTTPSRDGPPTASIPQPQTQATPTPARSLVDRPQPPTACPLRQFVIYFEWDRSNLNASALATIDTALEQTRSCTIAGVQIDGHSDTEPGPGYAVPLSDRRANTVREALIARGVSDALISTRAFGESDLAVQTPDGVREPLNRRAVITISFAP